LTGWLALSTPQQTPTVIFLLAGQSNMVGQGAARDLPPAYARIAANSLTWQDGQWRSLVPTGETFGPEFSFVHTFSAAFPNERIGIVKLAAGRWSCNDIATRASRRWRQFI
jgi:hypothetical protein